MSKMYVVVPVNAVLLRTITMAEAETAQSQNPGSLVAEIIMPATGVRIASAKPSLSIYEPPSGE